MVLAVSSLQRTEDCTREFAETLCWKHIVMDAEASVWHTLEQAVRIGATSFELRW